MRFRAAMRLGDTPVSIPNTMVKPQTADGTMLATAWESRRLPGHFMYKPVPCGNSMAALILKKTVP